MNPNEILNNIPPLSNNILIFDDLVPTFFQDYIEEYMTRVNFNLGSTGMGTSGVGDNLIKKMGLKNIKEHFQLVHTVYNDQSNRVNNLGEDSVFLTPMYLALAKIESFLPSIDFYLNRIKINLQANVDKSFKDHYNLPHMDVTFKGDKSLTMLYYVNDSDGDTFFFEENDPYMVIKDYNNLTLHKRISPKKGRVVIFRSDRIHAGSHPVDSPYRMVINYNVYPLRMYKDDSLEEKVIMEDSLKTLRKEHIEAEKEFQKRRG